MQKSMEKSSSSGHGVLGRLLEEQKHLCDEAVEDFIINLLFAGNETTSKTMLFAVYYLTHSPKAFEQLMVRSNVKLTNHLYTFFFILF